MRELAKFDTTTLALARALLDIRNADLGDIKTKFDGVLSGSQLDTNLLLTETEVERFELALSLAPQSLAMHLAFDFANHSFQNTPWPENDSFSLRSRERTKHYLEIIERYISGTQTASDADALVPFTLSDRTLRPSIFRNPGIGLLAETVLKPEDAPYLAIKIAKQAREYFSRCILGIVLGDNDTPETKRLKEEELHWQISHFRQQLTDSSGQA